MHRLAGQPWLPKEVKINKDRIQSPSPQQHPHKIPSVAFCTGSCKLDLVFYWPLVKSFLQIPSSPNPLLSSAAAEVAEENLSFFVRQLFSLFFKECEVKRNQTDGRRVWRLRLGCRNWGTLCLLFMHSGRQHKFLWGKQSLDVSAIHSPLLLFAVTASMGASYGGKVIESDRKITLGSHVILNSVGAWSWDLLLLSHTQFAESLLTPNENLSTLPSYLYILCWCLLQVRIRVNSWNSQAHDNVTAKSLKGYREKKKTFKN